MELICNVHKAPIRKAIVAGIALVCQRLNIDLVAEGVETQAEPSYLLESVGPRPAARLPFRLSGLGIALLGHHALPIGIVRLIGHSLVGSAPIGAVSVFLHETGTFLG
ncbi:MAG: hypothetical protein ACK40S_02570 [Burkholderiaceae bacterium]